MADMNLFKRTIPIAFTFIVTIMMILNYYMKLPFTPVENVLLSWSVVITTGALGLGVINLVQYHIKTISRRKGNEWLFSVLLLACMVFTILIGGIYGGESAEFNYLYLATLAPLSATLMAVFLVWIAPAFARYLNMRNISSTFLVGTLIICMICGGPLGQSVWPALSQVNAWIVTVAGMGAQRGLKIAIGFGMILITLRIITGHEKSFMKEEVS